MLVAVVVVPYVALLAGGARIARRLPLGVARARFVHRSFGGAAPPGAAARLEEGGRDGLLVVLLLALGA